MFCKAQFKCLKLGKAFVAPVEKESNLWMQGVISVIQLSAPNLDSSRPDSVSPKAGETLLRESYTALFGCFAELISVPAVPPSTSAPVPSYNPPQIAPSHNYNPGGWSAGLLAYLQPGLSPEMKSAIFWQDDSFVAIYDKFPKSRIHLLLMPRVNISSIGVLNRDHLPLLSRMKSSAQWIMQGLAASSVSNVSPLRQGFHAVPSMTQLHLHIISDDFDSPCLKKKKHYLSFTDQEFFIPIQTLQMRIKLSGSVKLDKHTYEQKLKGEIACHRCRTRLRNMPQLRLHLAICRPNCASPLHGK